MNREVAAEIRRLREERQRLLSADYLLSEAHWRRLEWCDERLQEIDPTWPKPIKGGDS